MEQQERIAYIQARIKSIRQAKGLSQRELIKRCNGKISRTCLSKNENAPTANPTVEFLYTIADVLEVPVTAFFFESASEFNDFSKAPLSKKYE